MIMDVGHLLPLPPGHAVSAAPVAAEAPVAARAKGRRPKHPYDEAVAEEILDRISGGETLATICRKRTDGLRPRHVYFWRNQHPEFSEQFGVARQIMGDALVDEMLGEIRESCYDRESSYACKVKVDSLQWVASRLNREAWGTAPDQFTQEIIVNQIMPDPASEVVPKKLVWADTRRLPAKPDEEKAPISP